MRTEGTDGKLHEECAVFGVSLVSGNEAAGITYNGLLTLQHRGQQSAGIAVVSGNEIYSHKNEGHVNEVFTNKVLGAFPESRTAVGHTRYSKSGSSAPGFTPSEGAGPFVTEYLTGRIASSLNGTLSNAAEIRGRLKSHGLNFHANSNNELVSSLIAYCIMKEENPLRGVIRAANDLKGAFSMVIMTGDNRLIAVRDPNGYRPLCIGKSDAGVCVASESCALDTCGFEFLRDVKPGEVIAIEDGKITFQSVELHKKSKDGGLCVFEYVYFARTDSLIDGLSVYEARYNMGKVLAREYPVEADVVCGVPDSGLDAAIGYSAESGIPLVTGFVMNRYVGRSFIYPTQSQRESVVKIKLNPLTANVRGKRMVILDDSIVRGTTTANIIMNLKSAGAKEVHVRISSPPFTHMCHYGTDIAAPEDLIANRMSLEGIRKQIGADSLGYISMGGLREACGKCGLPFCTNCFTGDNDGTEDEEAEQMEL
ncbi:MAG: amidophosphoribosyltransferase [Defluviitaleaceae bacterium]|nr:amidophosphoribosyltransferase [Defluviitaleaceae bacterium]